MGSKPTQPSLVQHLHTGPAPTLATREGWKLLGCCLLQPPTLLQNPQAPRFVPSAPGTAGPLQSWMPFSFSKPAHSAAAAGNFILPQTYRATDNFGFTLVEEATREVHLLVDSEQEAMSPRS